VAIYAAAGAYTWYRRPDSRLGALLAANALLAHAGPGARATVALRCHPTAIEFEVADDGTGFSSETAAQGHGLLSIFDGVEALGGTGTVRSTPAGGTTVSATIPIGARAEPSRSGG
jgi:glucose-6-phosphate-specific signal transduction histidine kinase